MVSDNTLGIKGFIGPFRDFQVNGWAFDPTVPDESLSIYVEVDGEKIGTTTASLFFDHLAKAVLGKATTASFLMQSSVSRLKRQIESR
jgi:hypothetical protein